MTSSYSTSIFLVIACCFTVYAANDVVNVEQSGQPATAPRTTLLATVGTTHRHGFPQP